MVTKGYVFGQWWSMGGSVEHLSRFAGSYPPQHDTVVKGGDAFAPSSAAVQLGPRTYSKKKKNGVRARHGLQASCQRFGIAFEAGWGTWERLPCARFAYTSGWPKTQGYTPV